MGPTPVTQPQRLCSLSPANFLPSIREHPPDNRITGGCPPDAGLGQQLLALVDVLARNP
jgi:hypothetical protein